jgi:hypothetical protein
MTFSIRHIVFLALFYCVTSHAAAIEDDDIEPPPTSQKTTDLQQGAGIKTLPLQTAARQPELSVQGIVVDIEPLLRLRQQYLSTQALQDSAQARYQEADQNLSRTRNLHDQDIVSTRRLQEQQAQWRNDKANLATSGYQQQALIASSQLQWGELLTSWFTQNNHPQAEQFLKNRAQLLQISLPSNTHLQPGQKTIWIDEQGRRQNAVTASLIASAPQVDPITQGERVFFKLEARKLPFGARITAWLPNDAQGSHGVIIPESAVVWHLGQAFVFIKTSDSKFERRTLPELLPNQNGYFAGMGFKAGEDIVITGAQTLLSQELKNLIPSEDND